MGFLENTLEDSPIVAAVKDDAGLEECLSSPCKMVFVLYGSINSVPSIVSQLKQAGKTVFVHADLIEGLSAREAAVDYLVKNACPDGIISTKIQLLRFAKAKGLHTILRFFLIDSIAMENISYLKNERYVDLVELMPGLMPKIIRQVSTTCGKPIIAGGLITEKSDVVNALEAGALAVSSTNTGVWKM
ncbi:glycerol-3-phosphate responsive antiterminator [uncultured Eubacterium sp.]|uniref:glycerol-3-phosphate responsive antiterminator n=1 Tax=uncultured Eubacterium sp. TaxID=165185 RepID=UPI0015A779A0|nr:glycerol-3-phosphate responsive antiterminator [uncultured Eubacterium sp.]